MLLVLLALLVVSVALLAAAVIRGWSVGRLLFDALGIFAGAAIGAAPGLYLIFRAVRATLGTSESPDALAIRLFALLASAGLVLGGLGGAAAAEAAFGVRPQWTHTAGLAVGLALGAAAVWASTLHIVHTRGMALVLAPVLLLALGLAGFSLGSPRVET